MRNIVLWCLAAGVALGLASCDYDLYVIEMTPKDDRIERKLTVAHVGGDHPPIAPMPASAPASAPVSAPATFQPPHSSRIAEQRLASIAKLYPGGHVAGNEKDTFTGTFGERLPADVGGRGYYLTQKTTLGSLRVYAEDFRGNDEPAAVLERAFKAADTLADLLAGYLKTRAGSDKDFDKLDRFLRGPLRQDVKNLYVHLLMMGQETKDRENAANPPEGDKPEARCIARVGLYLLARGYIQPADKDAMTKLKELPGGPAKDAVAKAFLATLVRRMLADKAGVKSPALAEAIEALVLTVEAQEAFCAYAKTRGYPMSRPASQPASAPADSPATSPAQAEEGTLFWLLWGLCPIELNFLYTPDQAGVSLATAVEPLHTNGRWDANGGKVTWQNRMGERDRPGIFLPPVCYALWAQPDAATQARHLGGTVLTGEELQSYCQWRASLSEAQGQEWDAAVAAMKGPGDLPKLQAFRFRGEPSDPPAEVVAKQQGGEEWNYHRRGAELIAKALAPKSPASQSQPASRPRP